MEVKFPMGDGTRQIIDGSVGINDGFCKIIIMVGIAKICHCLDACMNVFTVYVLSYAHGPGVGSVN